MINIVFKIVDVFKDGFLLEMWGGVIFDVVYNFLKENLWEWFECLCKVILNVLF